MEGTQVGTFR